MVCKSGERGTCARSSIAIKLLLNVRVVGPAKLQSQQGVDRILLPIIHGVVQETGLRD